MGECEPHHDIAIPFLFIIVDVHVYKLESKQIKFGQTFCSFKLSLIYLPLIALKAFFSCEFFVR